MLPCRYEKEYTPLLPEEIDSEGAPRRPIKDSYMQSRLDRFYAEVAQYQPGQSRAMYEEKLASMGDGLLPPTIDRCALYLSIPDHLILCNICRSHAGT
jgi:hypothetical protein